MRPMGCKSEPKQQISQRIQQICGDGVSANAVARALSGLVPRAQVHAMVKAPTVTKEPDNVAKP